MSISSYTKQKTSLSSCYFSIWLCCFVDAQENVTGAKETPRNCLDFMWCSSNWGTLQLYIRRARQIIYEFMNFSCLRWLLCTGVCVLPLDTLQHCVSISSGNILPQSRTKGSNTGHQSHHITVTLVHSIVTHTHTLPSVLTSPLLTECLV